jgi:DNA-binding transcriptional LysR family regulator
MAFDLAELRCFIAVSEESSFTRAADRLVCTPSNVSQRVRHLERALGVAVFVRTSRDVRLTRAGVDLLKLAYRVVGEADALQHRADELRQVASKQLTIAYGPFTGVDLTALIDKLRETRPDAVIETRALTSSSDVLRLVEHGIADVGLSKWPSERLESLSLQPVNQFALLVPASHRLHSRAEATIEDLDGEPLLIRDREPHPDMYDQLTRFFEERGVRPLYRHGAVTSIEQCHEFVATRQGLCFCYPSTAAPAGSSYLPLSGPLPPINQLYLVWDGKCERRSELLDELLAIVR